MKSDRQKTVRLGQLQDELKALKESLAKRSAYMLHAFYNDFVAPELLRLKTAHRGGWIRLGGLAILLLVDWRIAVGVLFVVWKSVESEARRLLGGWVLKAYILVTWEVSNEKIQEGWEPAWYQGLARQKDDASGFIYHLRPIDLAVRWWDSFKRVRAERKRQEAEDDGILPMAPEVDDGGDGQTD